MSARNYFRLSVNLPIDVYVTGAPAPVAATLVDISEGGSKIHSKNMLLKDSELSFELKRPGKEPLKLSGRVRHVDFKATTRTFDYGIEHVHKHRGSADDIYQYVLEEQRRKLQTKDGLVDRDTGPARKAASRENVLRVERKFPIEFVPYGSRTPNPAVAHDISRGGMRIVVDRVLAEDRTFELRFTLPADVLDVLTRKEHSRDGSIFGREISVKEVRPKPFAQVRIHAKILPGWHELKGVYHYSVAFVRPTPAALEEIERFLHAAQLTEIKAKRAPQKHTHR